MSKAPFHATQQVRQATSISLLPSLTINVTLHINILSSCNRHVDEPKSLWPELFPERSDFASRLIVIFAFVPSSEWRGSVLLLPSWRYNSLTHKCTKSFRIRLRHYKCSKYLPTSTLLPLLSSLLYGFAFGACGHRQIAVSCSAENRSWLTSFWQNRHD
jgi:hypothetical protein